ncbi:MAG: hypothetical protein ACRC2T_13045, partial [Thermoguttaceae bacterium]
LGQEDAITDMLAAYRALPAVPFYTFQPSNSIQPVTVRYANSPNGCYVYLVNDAPFSVECRITFSAQQQSKVLELTGRRQIYESFFTNNRLHWTVFLQPYDVIAVKINDPNASPVNVEVERPNDICGPKGKLSQKIDAITKALQNPVEYLVLDNSGFEHNVGRSAPGMIGWSRIGDDTFAAMLDTRVKWQGESSLKMISSGTSGGVISNPFDAPDSGRLFISFWIGVPEDTKQLPFRLALTGKYRGSNYLRTAPVGEAALMDILNSQSQNGVKWRFIKIPFTQLPLSGLEKLSVRLDMTGEGTVWIDDMRLDSIAFTEAERVEIMKQISVAGFRKADDRFSDSIALLEGFWPNLVLANSSTSQVTSQTQFASGATNRLYSSSNRQVSGNTVIQHERNSLPNTPTTPTTLAKSAKTEKTPSKTRSGKDENKSSETQSTFFGKVKSWWPGK